MQNTCPYLNEPYLNFLRDFRLDPRNQIEATFTSDTDTGNDEELGDIHLTVQGLWVDTILYEIPLLALTSEAYFRFMDKDWTYDGQEEKAYEKGMTLLEAGCIVSEFGTRRRRDYHTQALVFRGLVRAKKDAEQKGLSGKIAGSSNVHLAMRFGIPPVGTEAHEWFMGVAAITGSYQTATTTALQYWVGCFGAGVLGIALTDTFGTPVFLEAFSQAMPQITTAVPGAAATGASAVNTTTDGTISAKAPLDASKESDQPPQTFAQVFTGVRQDSGDPAAFVQMMRDFYTSQSPPIDPSTKTIVFSDSLNIELCLEYKRIAEEAGFKPTFGVGTFLTNDFTNTKTQKKSVPLNIVIKLSSAMGKPAVKISDNIGKNTGDENEVKRVKETLGYVEREWEGGDEEHRWGTEDDRGGI